MGPANPLYAEPTGYRATMVGIPYDHLDGWRAVYPPDVMAGQWARIADGWQEGLKKLEAAREVVDDAHRAAIDSEIRVNQAIYHHAKSVVNQVRFVMARNEMAKIKDASDARQWQHAIYATIWQRTGLSFPLVWNLTECDVPAVNVTSSYHKKLAAKEKAKEK